MLSLQKTFVEAIILVAIVVLLSILAWSLGEFQAALGDLRTSMFG